MPIPPRTIAPGTLVTCESEVCTPRGVRQEPHAISAACSHPRRVERPAPAAPFLPVRLVVCDAHRAPGARFTIHERSADCVDPIGVR
ncbi:hypothetical protein Leucomu_11250 [Leucobacter muris]|uniref:Uncharacterized protein n=1 Tax=Leucobacter muris TaxID=1935379 RepID=A0ABX5QHI6_9MICO|nr:hypothetical protein [Leucobacter muris]QAB17105.1 hypothetical protein Leucomu_03490 [Leucobacter muris]QAB18414.1 hypothetical protein Leucomu_11250 [Leucobacter muris]